MASFTDDFNCVKSNEITYSSEASKIREQGKRIIKLKLLAAARTRFE